MVDVLSLQQHSLLRLRLCQWRLWNIASFRLTALNTILHNLLRLFIDIIAFLNRFFEEGLEVTTLKLNHVLRLVQALRCELLGDPELLLVGAHGRDNHDGVLFIYSHLAILLNHSLSFFQKLVEILDFAGPDVLVDFFVEQQEDVVVHSPILQEKAFFGQLFDGGDQVLVDFVEVPLLLLHLPLQPAPNLLPEPLDAAEPGVWGGGI